MTESQASVRFYCSICKRRTKGFKNSELTHLKKAIIKELQKRLKNNHNAIGEQSFSIHCRQLSFVRLHVPEIDNSNISNKRKTKAKLSENGEMTITWKMMGGVDKENHKFEAGTAQFRFFFGSMSNLKYLKYGNVKIIELNFARFPCEIFF
ncbi:unnamed protein product [Rhizophagus irregularis]|nr:unnamed protein product [Rhizophagus irregularis]